MKKFQVLKFVSSDLKKIASNTFYQLLSKVITMSITFALTILISREYGAKGYGLFSIIQAFPALFYLIADFGLNAIATREISRNHRDSQKIFENTVFLRVMTSLVAIVICIITSLLIYNDPEIRYGILLGSIIIISQTLISTVNIIFQVKLRYELSSISNIAGYILILLATLILINYKVEVIYLNLIYVFGSFISLAFSLYFIRKFSYSFNFSYQKEISKNLLVESLPLGIMFLFSQINMRADSILLSVLRIPHQISNIEAVGIYSLPYKIFEVILVIPTYLMNSIYPIMISKFEENAKIFHRYLLKILKSMGGVGALTSFGAFGGVYIFFTPELISNLFGNEFQDSRYILLVLSSGLVLFFLTQPLSWYLIIRGHQKLLPRVYFIACIFNIALNSVLIPIYGYFASIVITLMSELLILLLLSYYGFKIKESN